MDDQQTWRQSLRNIAIWYHGLPGVTRTELERQISRMMSLKDELLALALMAGSADACSSCGGKCCLHGKFYVTMLDLAAYHRCGADPVVPDFGASPFCPYGSASGCRMEPRFRPMTCVIFNCEAIEERMDTAGQQQAREYEQELRQVIARAEEITGTGLARPVLLSCTNG